MPLQTLVQYVYSEHAVLTGLLILLLFFPAHLVPVTLEVGLHSIMTTDLQCVMCMSVPNLCDRIGCSMLRGGMYDITT